MLFKQFHFSFLICLFVKFSLHLNAEIKETHAIIGEWVATERLISEEESEWEIEKSALLDLKQALSTELVELNAKLKKTEEEAVGVAKQREDLTARKDAALQATRSLHQGLDQVVKKLERAFSLLPHSGGRPTGSLPQKTYSWKRNAGSASSSACGRPRISVASDSKLPSLRHLGKTGIYLR